MPKDTLREAHAVACRSEYDFYNKQEWRAKGLAVLRKLAKDLGLARGTYDIRFNAGGIAVSGDAILHSEHLYVSLSGFGHESAGYARKVKGRKDYVGERNVPIAPRYDDLLRVARALLDPSTPATARITVL